MMVRISQQQLESYLWGAATLLRGTIDAGDYKQFIFPLLFYKRLCDVHDEETQTALAESEGDKKFASYPENHRFQIPPEAHWREIRKVAKNVGLALQNAMRAIETANPDKLYGIFGDAQWTNKDRLSDAMLRDLIERFNSLELTIANLPEDELGNGYEYLIKKFADDAGHTAAEFYTNRTVVHLMTELLQPQPGESIYDPTCGSGGMLLSSIAHLRRQGKEWRNVGLFGQERNLMTSSIARMNCFLHGIEDFRIERGDTLVEPKFVRGDHLQQFDVVLANPPYSIKQWDREAFASDPWGRNIFGTPPQGRADYAFWQHIINSMSPKSGRCAILFPHGVLFRKEEAGMRQKLIEADLVECVLGLGPNLFYNSPMQSCVVVCRTSKSKVRRGKILFIDAVKEVSRERAQSSLNGKHIEHIVSTYQNFRDEPGFSRVVSIEEIRRNNHILNIPLYIQKVHPRTDRLSGDTSDLEEIFQAWRDSTLAVRESILNMAGWEIREILMKVPSDKFHLPDWLERSKWREVTLCEVAEEISAHVDDPATSGIERFVGLEHFDSGELKIRRWGTTENLISAMKKFSAGDTLFARRNAYLKRASLVDFDGLCSGDAIVLREREGQLAPGFLPFILNTDAFWQFAIANAAGTMSRRVNEKTLLKYEFALPPLDQQQRIAKILWAVDDVIQKYNEAFLSIDAWIKSFVEERFFDKKYPSSSLRVLLKEIVVGKSVVGVNQPAAIGEYGVLKVSAVGPKGFDAIEHKRLIDSEDFVSKFSVKSGDFLITRCNTKEMVGRVCIVPKDFPSLMLCDKTIKLDFDIEKVSLGFMEAVLKARALRIQIEAIAVGTGRAMKNISQDGIKSLVVPLPSLNEQYNLVAQIEKGSIAKASLETEKDAVINLRRRMINSLFEVMK